MSRAVEPGGLIEAVARRLPEYRWVSMHDVRAASAARPDVQAAILGRGSDALPARPLAAVQDLLRDLRAAPRVELAGLAVLVGALRRLAEGMTWS